MNNIKGIRDSKHSTEYSEQCTVKVCKYFDNHMGYVNSYIGNLGYRLKIHYIEKYNITKRQTHYFEAIRYD